MNSIEYYQQLLQKIQTDTRITLEVKLILHKACMRRLDEEYLMAYITELNPWEIDNNDS